MFTFEKAQETCNQYINVLWHCIDKRVQKTDFSESQCAFSEASAETVFSVYGRVIEGRGSISISNAVGLTRIALQLLQKRLTEEALDRYPSKYKARFCTHMWFKGATSKVIKKVQAREWDL